MKIDRYKRATKKLIGEYKSMSSPAHISIDNMPRQKPFLTEPAIDRMEPRMKSMPPVLLHLDGFGYFQHLHDRTTVYASIKETPSTDNWFKLLLKNMNIKRAMVPHITIARDISGEQFNKLWPVIRHKKLNEPFWINEMVVLRRDTFSGSRAWQPYKMLPFKNEMTFGEGSIASNIDPIKPQIGLF